MGSDLKDLLFCSLGNCSRGLYLRGGGFKCDLKEL